MKRKNKQPKDTYAPSNGEFTRKKNKKSKPTEHDSMGDTREIP